MRIPFPGASLRSLAGWCGRPSSSCSSTTSSSATSSQLFRWDFGISSEWWGGGWSVADGTRIDRDFYFPDLGIGGTVTMFSSHSPTGRKPYQRFILFYCTQVRPLVGLVNYSLSDLLITLSLTNLLTPHSCLLLRKAFYRTDPSPIISWPCHSLTYVFETEIM